MYFPGELLGVVIDFTCNNIRLHRPIQVLGWEFPLCQNLWVSSSTRLKLMSYLTRSLTVLGTSLALNLVVAQITPVQAASLIYTNNPADFALFDFSFGPGRGNLLLRGVLTEPGIVTTQYSEIRASALAADLTFSYRPFARFFPVQDPSSFTFTFDPARDARLTFNNGSLVGLFYTSETQRFTFSDNRSCNPRGRCISGEGFVSLFLGGNQAGDFVRLRVTESTSLGQILIRFEENRPSSFSGSINFSTLRAVEAVPEPATVLGTGLVVALGAGAKRYRDRHQK